MNTRFTELIGCSVPIQLAAMPGIATPDLAIAVAEAGGLGMISAVRQTARGLLETIELIRRRTNNIGVNFLVPFLDQEILEVAARKAKVVEFFYSDPTPLLVKCARAHGALVSWQVGSVAEGIAAAHAGCDFIVAQGNEAGGHVRGHQTLDALLAGLSAAVSIPVLAAGGVASNQDFAAVLATGADGARLGTRFVAATESAAHPDYVNALLNATAADTVITETFSANWPNAPHRVLRSCVEAATSFSGEVVAETDVDGVQIPVRRFWTPAPTKSTRGFIPAMALYAGESVSRVNEIKPARQIIEELLGRAG